MKLSNSLLTKHFSGKRLASLGMFAGPITLTILLFFSFLIHEENFKELGITAIIGITGVVLGWGIGFVFSPDTVKPSFQFQMSATTHSILIFIAGYLTAKLAPVIFDENIFITQPAYGTRLLVFLICLVIATMNMYIYRKFLDDFAQMMFDTQEDVVLETVKQNIQSVENQENHKAENKPKPEPKTKSRVKEISEN
jgi:hypothetical protein